MDAILEGETTYQRHRVLHSITGSGLKDAYDATLDRIREQGGRESRLGLNALMWISHSERPLGSEELCHALAIELGAYEINPNNIPAIGNVLPSTLGLVTIDKKASTVHLIHPTLREYLLQLAPFATTHSMMAEICLTYLNCRSIQALRLEPDNVLETSPFLEYATCFWGTHATKRLTERAQLLALLLLNKYENHVSAAVFWRKKVRNEYDEAGDVEGITGLHCIAFWGIPEIASLMLKTHGPQLNRCDSMGRTPLIWAVEYERTEVVNLFLNQGAIEPGMHQMVFSFASWVGDEGAVKMLLEHDDVNPNSPDSKGRTPILLATMGGHKGVVRLLLEQKNVNPDSPDSNGRTPLSLASWRGNGGIVKLLLERKDVNPHSSDHNGRTPLSFASMEGHEGVMKRPSVRKRPVRPVHGSSQTA